MAVTKIFSKKAEKRKKKEDKETERIIKEIEEKAKQEESAMDRENLTKQIKGQWNRFVEEKKMEKKIKKERKKSEKEKRKKFSPRYFFND